MSDDNINPLLENLDKEYHPNEASSKKSAAYAEKKGEARCRLCLSVKMQVRGLSKHVQNKHKDFYKLRCNPLEYAATENQIIPADPEYRKATSKP